MGQSISTPASETASDMQPQHPSLTDRRSAIISTTLPADQSPVIAGIMNSVQTINSQIAALADNDDAKREVYARIMSQEPQLHDFMATYALKHDLRIIGNVDKLKKELKTTRSTLKDKEEQCDNLIRDLEDARATILARDDEIEVLLEDKRDIQVLFEEVEINLAASRKTVGKLQTANAKDKAVKQKEIEQLTAKLAVLQTERDELNKYHEALQHVHQKFNSGQNANKKRHLDQLDSSDLPILPAKMSVVNVHKSNSPKSPSPGSSTGTFDKAKHAIRFSIPEPKSSGHTAGAASVITPPDSKSPKLKRDTHGTAEIAKHSYIAGGTGRSADYDEDEDTDDEIERVSSALRPKA